MSNPDAPKGVFARPKSKSGGGDKMNNQDFRKMMMTPRVSIDATPRDDQQSSNDNNGDNKERVVGSVAAGIYASYSKQKGGGKGNKFARSSGPTSKKDKAESEFYKQRAKEKAEFEAKYRDRANERRSGQNKDYSETEKLSMEPATLQNLTEEDRRIVMEESKFLGGDMKHTHLVKGLDYALLQKVKAEAQEKENASLSSSNNDSGGVGDKNKVPSKEMRRHYGLKKGLLASDIKCKGKAARSIVRVLFEENNKKNEIFRDGYMAYVFNLNDNDSIDGEGAGGDRGADNDNDVVAFASMATTDVPTITFRSVSDKYKDNDTETTNDIVINKLTQIFSHIRSGSRKSKHHPSHKKGSTTATTTTTTTTTTTVKNIYNKNSDKKQNTQEDSIFSDAEDEVKVTTKSKSSSKKASRWGSSYFNDPKKNSVDDRGQLEVGPQVQPSSQFDNDDSLVGVYPEPEEGELVGAYPGGDEEECELIGAYPDENGGSMDDVDESLTRAYPCAQHDDDDDDMESNNNNNNNAIQLQKMEMKRLQSSRNEQNTLDSYSECYPGMSTGATYEDSDEEADYTKMDPGLNKKGQLKRWDFANEDDWEKHKETTEALPKAAFQFGVKMSDGRSTRRKGGGGKKQTQEQKIARELQKMENIMKKRKDAGQKVASSTEDSVKRFKGSFKSK